MGGGVRFQDAGEGVVPRDLQVHLIALHRGPRLLVYVRSLHAGDVEALLIASLLGAVVVQYLAQTLRQGLGLGLFGGVGDLIQGLVVLHGQDEAGAVVFHIVGGIRLFIRAGIGIEVAQPVRLLPHGLGRLLGPGHGDDAVDGGIGLGPVGGLVQDVEAEVGLLLLVLPHHTGGFTALVVIQHGHGDNEIVAPVLGDDPVVLLVFRALVRRVLRVVGAQARVLFLEVDRNGGVSRGHLQLYLVALGVLQEGLLLRIPVQDEVHCDVVCSHIYLLHCIASRGLGVHAQGGAGSDRVLQGLRQLCRHTGGGGQRALDGPILILIQLGYVVYYAAVVFRLKGQLPVGGRRGAEADLNGHVAAGSGRLDIGVARGAVARAELGHLHRGTGARTHGHYLHIHSGLGGKVHLHLVSRLDLGPVGRGVHSGVGSVGHGGDLVLAVGGVHPGIIGRVRGGHKAVRIVLGGQHHIHVHALIGHHVSIYVVAGVVRLDGANCPVGFLVGDHHLDHTGAGVLGLDLGGNGLALDQVGKHVLHAVLHLAGDKAVIGVAQVAHAEGGGVLGPTGHLVGIGAHHMEGGGQSGGPSGHKVHMHAHVADGSGGGGHGELLYLAQGMVTGVGVGQREGRHTVILIGQEHAGSIVVAVVLVVAGGVDADLVAGGYGEEVSAGAVTGGGGGTQGVGGRDGVGGYAARHIVLSAVGLGAAGIGSHDYNVIPRLGGRHATFVDNIDVGIARGHGEGGGVGVGTGHAGHARGLGDVGGQRLFQAIGEVGASRGGGEGDHLIVIDNVRRPDKVVSIRGGLRLHCQGNKLVGRGLQNGDHAVIGVGDGSRHDQRGGGVGRGVGQNGLVVLLHLNGRCTVDQLIHHVQTQVVLCSLDLLQVDDDAHVAGGHGEGVGGGRGGGRDLYRGEQQSNGRTDHAVDLVEVIYRHRQGHGGGVVDQDALAGAVGNGMGSIDRAGAGVALALEGAGEHGIVIGVAEVGHAVAVDLHRGGKVLGRVRLVGGKDHIDVHVAGGHTEVSAAGGALGGVVEAGGIREGYHLAAHGRALEDIDGLDIPGGVGGSGNAHPIAHVQSGHNAAVGIYRGGGARAGNARAVGSVGGYDVQGGAKLLLLLHIGLGELHVHRHRRHGHHEIQSDALSAVVIHRFAEHDLAGGVLGDGIAADSVAVGAGPDGLYPLALGLVNEGLARFFTVGGSHVLFVGALAGEHDLVSVRAIGGSHRTAGIADLARHLEPGGNVPLEGHVDDQVGCGHLDLGALVVSGGQGDIGRHAAALGHGDDGLHLVAALHGEAQVEHLPGADAVPELEGRQVAQVVEVGVVAVLAAAHFIVHDYLDLVGFLLHPAELRFDVGGVGGHGEDVLGPGAADAALVEGHHHPLPGGGIGHQAIERAAGGGCHLGADGAAVLDHHGVPAHGGGGHGLAGGGIVHSVILPDGDLVGVCHHRACDHQGQGMLSGARRGGGLVEFQVDVHVGIEGHGEVVRLALDLVYVGPGQGGVGGGGRGQVHHGAFGGDGVGRLHQSGGASQGQGDIVAHSSVEAAAVHCGLGGGHRVSQGRRCGRVGGVQMEGDLMVHGRRLGHFIDHIDVYAAAGNAEFHRQLIAVGGPLIADGIAATVQDGKALQGMGGGLGQGNAHLLAVQGLDGPHAGGIRRADGHIAGTLAQQGNAAGAGGLAGYRVRQHGIAVIDAVVGRVNMERDRIVDVVGPALGEVDIQVVIARGHGKAAALGADHAGDAGRHIEFLRRYRDLRDVIAVGDTHGVGDVLSGLGGAAIDQLADIQVVIAAVGADGAGHTVGALAVAVPEDQGGIELGGLPRTEGHRDGDRLVGHGELKAPHVRPLQAHHACGGGDNRHIDTVSGGGGNVHLHRVSGVGGREHRRCARGGMVARGGRGSAIAEQPGGVARTGRLVHHKGNADGIDGTVLKVDRQHGLGGSVLKRGHGEGGMDRSARAAVITAAGIGHVDGIGPVEEGNIADVMPRGHKHVHRHQFAVIGVGALGHIHHGGGRGAGHGGHGHLVAVAGGGVLLHLQANGAAGVLLHELHRHHHIGGGHSDLNAAGGVEVPGDIRTGYVALHGDP